MCGIYCSVYNVNDRDTRPNIHCGSFEQGSLHSLHPCNKIKELLERRGPDRSHEVETKLTEDWMACCMGSVLWTQGQQPVRQPLQDNQGNFLLWNGDVLHGSLENDKICDSEVVFEQFKKEPLSAAMEICGPYAFVFWHRSTQQLWFGRDVFGRQSLLWSVSPLHLTLSSVAHRNSDLIEAPALGIFMVDLSDSLLPEIHFFPWAHLSTGVLPTLDIPVVEGKRLVHCKLGDGSSRLPWLGSEPSEDDLSVYQDKIDLDTLLQEPIIGARVEKLLTLLTSAVECRVNKHPGVCLNCSSQKNESPPFGRTKDFDTRDIDAHGSFIQGSGVQSLDTQDYVPLKCNHCKVAVLFSGGLDSTVLAVIADRFVHEDSPIDLYNVAFQQPCGNYDVPDRMTGRESYQELQNFKLSTRKWNFVEVDVTQEELARERSHHIADLVHPLASVLDDSLGCALWFAARGRGIVDGHAYNSPARVVLVGMGADEQLGGYTRHRNTLRHSGQWSALGQELTADTDNIARRNMGRDNRIMSDHGRQPRSPFLDEAVVAHINSLPPWNRCLPITDRPPGNGDKLLLRLLARRLNLQTAATLPKRALQFGSRIANRKEKGDHISHRL